MRMAFLTSEFITEPYFDGGEANYLHRVTAALAARGHDVELFVPGESNEEFKHGSIVVRRVRVKRLLPHRVRKIIKFFLGAHEAMVSLELALALREAFLDQHSRRPFDIVQAASYRATGLFLGQSGCCRKVVRLSNYRPLFDEANGIMRSFDVRLASWLERLGFRNSSGIYAPSRLIADAVYHDLGVPVSVVRPPFCLDVEEEDTAFRRRNLEGISYLLFYGTFSKLKGAETLVTSVPRCLADLPDAHFVCVGKPDPGRDYFSEMTSCAGDMARRIHGLEPVRHPWLFPIIRGSRMVVLPSLVDNLPDTCMESMALGKIVIGTWRSSMDELIEDGISGFLVPPGDAIALAETVIRVWNLDRNHAREISRAARERMSLLLPDRCAEDLERYCRGLIQPGVNEGGGRSSHVSRERGAVAP